MASPDVRKPSWRERLTSVSKRLGVGSPGRNEKDQERGKRVSRKDSSPEWESADESEEWCILDIDTNRSTGVGVNSAGHFEVREREALREKGDMESTDGLLDRLKGSKKAEKTDGKSSNATASAHLGSPASGVRRTSFGSRLKPEGSKLGRPGSPQPGTHSPLQRRPSGRGKKLNVYDNLNGQASPRSGSPSRVGSARKKSGGAPVRTESPNPMDRRNESSLHAKQAPQQNGKNGSGSLSSSPASGESAFAKVRDTLKISKAKKKLKKKKGTAYSVAPVEINFPQTKYQDPFEAQPNFTDSTEVVPSGAQSHDFKPVSIPHNKPEYCDHCGETAWGLYRQVLKCSKCDFIVHRKCEAKVVIDCSVRLEQAVLQHDKQVEEITVAEEEIAKEKEDLESAARVTAPSDQSESSHQTSAMSHHHASPQVLSEKAKLAKKIREYNRKTTPVHHIHIKSSHSREGAIEYNAFVRVHMCVQRPIHVSTAITRTSWYRLMRPVKERSEDAGLETAFYLPTDTNRLVHITNMTTTKELIQILLKKFCVTDNPKKFSLYEEYGGDCRRLFEEDNPLEIVLEASVTTRNSKLVLRDNTYSTIQWDAFSQPELNNFISILKREEELYAEKLEERFKVWKNCISHALKEKCREEISMQTFLQHDVRNGEQKPKMSTLLESRTKA